MDQREELHALRTSEHCGRDTSGAGGHWCSQGAKAKMKRDGLYPDYVTGGEAPYTGLPTIDFTPKEVGLLSVAMVVAGLVGSGNRPLPRTMDVLTTNRAAMFELTRKLMDVSEGVPTPAIEPVDATQVRHKAFEDVLAMFVAGACMNQIRDYCATEFDATKGGVL